MILECNFLTPHEHELPDDWQFGGASNTDPRVDRRWPVSLYEYWDDQVRIIHSANLFCDQEALDYCTKIADWGAGFNPVWVSVIKPGKKIRMLKFTYDKSTDELVPNPDA